MFTRNAPVRSGQAERSHPRSLAAFCTALLTGVALAVLPSLPVMADGVDTTDLTVAAQEARAAADAGHAQAAASDAAATAAAADAAALRTAADAASAASTAAADAATAAPDDTALQAAAADAAAAFAAADALAATAEQAAADAVTQAQADAANAAVLEATAVAAEAALAEAVAAEEEPAAEEPGDEAGEESLAVSSERKSDNCDHDADFFSQDKSRWEWCLPEPDIDIDVVNVCPTEIVVHLSKLWPWIDYKVVAGGSERAITVDKWGKASFTVTDFTSGEFEVKIYHGDKKIAYENEKIKGDCPWISTEVEHVCRVIGGTAEVEVKVGDLQWWREYDITVSNSNGYLFTDSTSGHGYWSEDLDLEPGTYTVMVTSDGGKHAPDLGPVYYEFTVAPCPGEVVITITPVCATDGSGSLGASLSGLVPGREYHVTVTGPDGTVTDVTFVATDPTWPVPPAQLPKGSYTVTVVDTEGYASSMMSMDSKKKPHHDPLSWTATGTIADCPPDPAPAVLAVTGGGASSALLPGLLLVPLGAGLLAVSRRRIAGIR